MFDRSWYGRVLVERVEEFATQEEWERAYPTIVGFERTFCDEGGMLVKFWMHVSPEEQLHRFEKRQKNPLKSWKITDEDWRNREKRPLYEQAVEDMLDPHRPPAGAVAPDRGRLEALRAREGDRDGERGGRAGDAGERVPGAYREQRQGRLPHALQDLDVNLHTCNAAGLGKRACLRLDLLRGEDSTTAVKAGFLADAFQIPASAAPPRRSCRCA